MAFRLIKAFRKTVFVLALLSLVAVFCYSRGCWRAGKVEQGRFIDKVHGYSITLPSGWSFDSPDKDLKIVRLTSGSETGYAKDYIFIGCQEEHSVTKTEELKDVFQVKDSREKEAIQSRSEEIQHVSGLEAYVLKINYDYNGELITRKVVGIVHDGYPITFETGGPLNGFDAVEPVFDSIWQSFRVEN